MQQKKTMLAADWLLWVTTRGLYFPSLHLPNRFKCAGIRLLLKRLQRGWPGTWSRLSWAFPFCQDRLP
ncbi:hypothetical protein H8959_016975 [Pygathrix nigripes]